MDTKKLFFGIWTFLGLAQTAFTVGGCTASTPNDTLLSSNDPSVENSKLSEVKQTRLSRAFFERSLTGTLLSREDALDSDVDWREPTGLSADHEGCAVFRQIPNVRLCFNIMSDVTSVGLNNDDVKLLGLGKTTLVNAAPADSTVVLDFVSDSGGVQVKLRQI